MHTRSLTQDLATKQLMLLKSPPLMVRPSQKPQLGHDHHKTCRTEASCSHLPYDQRRRLWSGIAEESTSRQYALTRAQHPHLLQYTHSANTKRNIHSSDPRVLHRQCASTLRVRSSSSPRGNVSEYTIYKRKSSRRSFNLVLAGSATSHYTLWATTYWSRRTISVCSGTTSTSEARLTRLCDITAKPFAA